MAAPTQDLRDKILRKFSDLQVRIEIYYGKYVKYLLYGIVCSSLSQGEQAQMGTGARVELNAPANGLNRQEVLDTDQQNIFKASSDAPSSSH
jgi:hypothetical protein